MVVTAVTMPDYTNEIILEKALCALKEWSNFHHFLYENINPELSEQHLACAKIMSQEVFDMVKHAKNIQIIKKKKK